MFVGTLLLVSLAHCASQTLCPSKGELESAIRSRADQELVPATTADRQGPAGAPAKTQAERIVGISDIYCGDTPPGEASTVNCKFTVRYPSKIEFQVAELSREGKSWVIEDALVVTKKRK